MQSRGRQVGANQPVLDQAEFFQNDGFTLVTGITPVQLTSILFFNNVVQPWPLVDGTSTTDAQIASGKVYFSAIPGAPGYYSLRFFPGALGFWRVILTYAIGQQIVAQDYDVVAPPLTPDTGLKASFVRHG